ncbi:MAG: hypothetical protein KGM98_07065, partial [Bacteroidota bacterium]|nr:hypothetical protein [Bacteroidota bacterium]
SKTSNYSSPQNVSKCFCTKVEKSKLLKNVTQNERDSQTNKTADYTSSHMGNYRTIYQKK